MAPSHAEIWDDSALVDSWNEALDEYKKYHSINAQGENAEEVLALATEKADNQTDETNSKEAANNGPTVSVPSTNGSSSEEVLRKKRSEQSEQFQKPAADFQANAQETEIKHSALPQHLIGQVHDEALKNLLMSWYYAGYYTGLYEGQQHNKAA